MMVNCTQKRIVVDVSKVDSIRYNILQNNHFVLLLLLVGLSFLTYCNTFNNNGLIYDNRPMVVDDVRIREISSENLKRIFFEEYLESQGGGSGVYRPVSTLSYLFNYSILGNGADALGYHVTNWLLHVTNAVMLYFLALRISGRRDESFFTAAIFAVHPVNVEAVTNIVGRCDLLATSAVLASLHCYALSLSSSRFVKYKWYSLMSLCWLGGLFSKESAVVLPVLMVVYDLTMHRWEIQPTRDNLATLGVYCRRFQGYLVLLPPLLVFYFVRKSVFAGQIPAWHDFLDNPLVGEDFWLARLTAVKVVGKYLLLLAWPVNLSVDYSYNQIPVVRWPFSGWEDWQVSVSSALLFGLVGYVFSRYRRCRPSFFMGGLFFVALMPIANLLPRPGAVPWEAESWLIGTIMAERLMYLPSIGFAGIIVATMYNFGEALSRINTKLAASSRLIAFVAPSIVLCFIVLCLSTRAYLRNFDWQSDLALWSDAVAASPNSFRTHMAMASVLRSTDLEGLGIDMAIAEAEKAFAITDRFEPLMVNLGGYYREKGDLLGSGQRGAPPSSSGASWWYEKSVMILRRAAAFDQGVINQEHRARAIKAGKKTSDIADVGNTETYYNLGLSLLRLGKYRDALDPFRYMIHLSPFDVRSYREMAGIYRILNDPVNETTVLHQLWLLKNQEPEFVDRLAQIYQQQGLGSCVEIPKGGVLPEMLHSCRVWYNDVCLANQALVDTLIGAKEYDVAREVGRGGLQMFGCAEDYGEPFEIQSAYPLK